MGQVMYLGGRKVLSVEEIEQRRQALVEMLGVNRGEAAGLREQLADVEVQARRLEGGIIECGWALEQMTAAPVEPVEEES